MDVDRAADQAFVIWRGTVLVSAAPQRNLLRLSKQTLQSDASVTPVVAGGGSTIAAFIVEAADEAAALAAIGERASGASFADVMFELGRFEPNARATLLRAIAIERWSNRYRFCPTCGTPLIWTTDAISKICTRPQRVHRHFPRVDPAIIVLVTAGDRALLGRPPRFPPGFYSTLAGFVEAGESVEAAVVREVYEEAGIRVGATRYFGSEPWPFPRSLMLGFFAEARTETIELRDGELEDARWFDRSQLRELQTTIGSARPHVDTIARRLIETWLEQPESVPP